MRMNDTLLGYLNAQEAVRRQSENPYLYLNQMADMAKINRLYTLQKDIITESAKSDSVNLKSQSTKDSNGLKIKKEDREKNNGLDGYLFYSSSGTGIKENRASTFEYLV